MAFRGERPGRPWCSLLAALACLNACGDEPAARGELGNVTFTYVCVGDGDYQCLDGERGMPDFHGVGAHFDVEGDELFSTRENLETAAPGMIAKGSDSFTFLEEGHGAILIFENFGEIEDFVHLQGIRIETLRVQDEGRNPVSTLTFMAGTRTSILVIPEARNGIIPGGSFDYVWESDDESVVLPSDGFGKNRVELVGMAPGSAILSVAVLGLSSRVTVNVTENPNAPVALEGGVAPAPLSDASSDGGAFDGGAFDGGSVAGDSGVQSDAARPPAPSDASAIAADGSQPPLEDASAPLAEAGAEGGAP